MNKVRFILLSKSGMRHEEYVYLDSILNFEGINHEYHKTSHADYGISQFTNILGNPILTLDFSKDKYIIVQSEREVRIKCNRGLTDPDIQKGIFIFNNGDWLNPPKSKALPKVENLTYKQLDNYKLQINLDITLEERFELRDYVIESDVECETKNLIVAFRVNKKLLEIVLSWIRVFYNEDEDAEEELPLLVKVLEFNL